MSFATKTSTGQDEHYKMDSKVAFIDLSRPSAKFAMPPELGDMDLWPLKGKKLAAARFKFKKTR